MLGYLLIFQGKKIRNLKITFIIWYKMAQRNYIFVFIYLVVSMLGLYYVHDKFDAAFHEYTINTKNDATKFKTPAPYGPSRVSSSLRTRATPWTPSIGPVVRAPVHLSEQDYFEMKYSQQPQPQRLMNMSLTVAESGALALRVSSEAVESLDYKTLRLRTMAREGAAGPAHHNSLAGNSSSVKHILYWNKFSNFDNFNFGAGEEAFVRHGCAVSACSATEDRSLVPEDRVDAVVYCLSLNDKTRVPVPSPPRYPNAKRVVFARESPSRQSRSLKMYGRSFEYTVSYRYDSDARTGYGAVYAKNGEADDNFTNINLSNGKTKMAAWFVSNCHSTPSMRDRLTKKLQLHGVAVDIFGKCGSLHCPKTPDNNCHHMLEKTYKFYFSFENSLCNHYVTEKFNKILQYNVVPVTYGLGHELSGVPKDAYIDVFDFPDVKSLAQYLMYLDSNDTAYNEYFRWKKHYHVTKNAYHPFCELCADLHADPPLPQKKYDLHAWFSEGQCINVKKNPRLMSFLGI